GAAGLIVLLGLARLLQHLGALAVAELPAIDFIGVFLAGIGEILDVGFTVIAALATAAVAAMLASRLGYGIRRHLEAGPLTVVSLLLAALAGAAWGVLVAAVIDWFYLIDDTLLTGTIPAVVGAALGLLVGWRGLRKGVRGIGLSIYYAARTIFNTLRSIEPLVMAIVFVVWVGIGPFAGALALALHTVAALTKLYSEQVESIAPGPIEAVRATGANRLQTIV